MNDEKKPFMPKISPLGFIFIRIKKDFHFLESPDQLPQKESEQPFFKQLIL